MNRTDPTAPIFGLPPCLHVPIAAADRTAIENFVGTVEKVRESRKGEVTAMLVRPDVRGRPAHGLAPLWNDPRGDWFAQRLFPDYQVWVHVDYPRYRPAYVKFGMPPLLDDQVLDHVQNRKALRLRWCSHPFLRLCPVSRSVNSGGCHRTGAEGIEKAHLEKVHTDAKKAQDLKSFALSYRIIYADPADLTKMLDMSPGTFQLEGVGENLRLFYP